MDWRKRERVRLGRVCVLEEVEGGGGFTRKSLTRGTVQSIIPVSSTHALFMKNTQL